MPGFSTINDMYSYDYMNTRSDIHNGDHNDSIIIINVPLDIIAIPLTFFHSLMHL